MIGFLKLKLKGVCKYYISTLGGVGVLTQLADNDYAVRGGGRSRCKMLMHNFKIHMLL